MLGAEGRSASLSQPPTQANSNAASAVLSPPLSSTLSSAQATLGTGNTALANKIQKTLSTHIDAQATRDALVTLSGFFDENTVHTRRNLRLTVEGQNLILHQEFISAFSELERQLQGVETIVGALDSACQHATLALNKSRHETHSILGRAGTLRNESTSIDEKQLVLTRFLQKFRVPQGDRQLMKSGDQPIDDEFFLAFDKLGEVRRNARQMLSICGQQTSGVDILHETSEDLEAAYERMFIWMQQQCRGPSVPQLLKQDLLDTPQGTVLRRTLSLLADRPVYFNHCLRDISRVRRQALVQRFSEELSKGNASGARLIEMQAVDPVRFIGDILAWVHENTAFEMEGISMLMPQPSIDDAGQPSSSSLPTLPSGEPTPVLVTASDMVDFALEGLVQPLNNRVHNILVEQSSIVVVYKIAQVFGFFQKTLEAVLRRPDGCLVVLCNNLHEKTHQAFLDMWDAQAQKLRRGVVGIYVSDLSTPSFVTEAVSTLTEVLAVYDAALIPSNERELDFLPILSAAYDPLLNHCQQVAALMESTDGVIFLINCIAAMQAPLRKYDFASQRVSMYDSLLDDQTQTLVDGQATMVLIKLGLSEKLKALREKPPETPLSAVPELHTVSLTTTLQSFYNLLFTLGGALALPLLERITNRDLRSEARSGVTRKVSEAYKELYEGIKELGVATHTPEQVDTLLE